MEFLLVAAIFVTVFAFAIACDTLVAWAIFALGHAAVHAIPQLDLVHSFYAGLAIALICLAFKPWNRA